MSVLASRSCIQCGSERFFSDDFCKTKICQFHRKFLIYEEYVLRFDVPMYYITLMLGCFSQGAEKRVRVEVPNILFPGRVG